MIDRVRHHDLSVSFSTPLRDLVADAALLLILGGLSLIALIVSLVLLGSLFPAAPRDSGKPRPGVARQLRSAGSPAAEGDDTVRLPADPRDHAAGWERARRLQARDLDAALDHVVAHNLGEPRILSVGHDRIVLRLSGCAAHAPPTTGEGPAPGCGYVRGFLQRILQETWKKRVEIRETRCESEPHPVCEFEMRAQRGA